ncbi:Acyl carrier protein [Nocardia amikacinitolerans]|uniref:Acyl carrier protein n=1 Tax=Nocardia amikacinitolerans TaxID=756689 RepID=A0A285L6G5_9NOCA|nr:acyl carrier protein [Nocardia amikacinitolerans]MCP2274697.1 Acyl carrier protein [Nocardia amikacinitolerans]MCP2296552.1 Acyl carrier protein [Nocardia amikacinitolerans]SNY80482.1 Acyl carrier protein [Nocardia amikacinitolerans]
MRTLVLAQQGALVVDWLTARVADHLDRSARDIDPTLPLAELGLDSVSAVNICGEIEDEWDLDLDPTIVFEYPTILDLAVYITDQVADRLGLAA